MLITFWGKWHSANASCVVKFWGKTNSFIYLNIILAINQLNAKKSSFLISLLYVCTCFEHYVFIIGRSKLYYTASGVITPVGGRPVHRLREDCAWDGHLQSVTIPDAV